MYSAEDEGSEINRDWDLIITRSRTLDKEKLGEQGSERVSTLFAGGKG